MRQKPEVLMIDPSDYATSTLALSSEQHGALLLLMMSYQYKGSLPADDGMLSRIARTTEKRWKRVIRPGIAEFLVPSGDGLAITLVDKWHSERAALERLDVPASAWALLRAAVFQRDNFVCTYCGEAELAKPHCDHVVPRAQGGASTLDNLATACAPCNIRKGARRPEEWLQ